MQKRTKVAPLPLVWWDDTQKVPTVWQGFSQVTKSAGASFRPQNYKWSLCFRKHPITHGHWFSNPDRTETGCLNGWLVLWLSWDAPRSLFRVLGPGSEWVSGPCLPRALGTVKICENHSVLMTSSLVAQCQQSFWCPFSWTQADMLGMR